jgi:hypothetical protein
VLHLAAARQTRERAQRDLRRAVQAAEAALARTVDADQDLEAFLARVAAPR